MNLTELSRQAGIEILRPEYAQAIHELAPNPSVAECAAELCPRLSEDALQFIDRCIRERQEGISFVHAVVADKRLRGLCGLHNVAPQQTARLSFWIGEPFRGRGYATFAAGNMLDFAFGPLRLSQVFCDVAVLNVPARRVLEKHGFLPNAAHSATAQPAVLGEEVTRARYLAGKHAPFLRDLTHELKPILEAELSWGNEIGECSRGWPEKDSVIIALQKPFRYPPSPLPDNVLYREVNDTHWWKAEFATKKPVHLLTCGF